MVSTTDIATKTRKSPVANQEKEPLVRIMSSSSLGREAVGSKRTHQSISGHAPQPYLSIDIITVIISYLSQVEAFSVTRLVSWQWNRASQRCFREKRFGISCVALRLDKLLLLNKDEIVLDSAIFPFPRRRKILGSKTRVAETKFQALCCASPNQIFAVQPGLAHILIFKANNRGKLKYNRMITMKTCTSSLVFIPERKWLIASSVDQGYLTCMDSGTGRILYTYKPPHSLTNYKPLSMCLNQDKSLLYVAWAIDDQESENLRTPALAKAVNMRGLSQQVSSGTYHSRIEAIQNQFFNLRREGRIVALKLGENEWQEAGVIASGLNRASGLVLLDSYLHFTQFSSPSGRRCISRICVDGDEEEKEKDQEWLGMSGGEEDPWYIHPIQSVRPGYLGITSVGALEKLSICTN